MAINTVKKVNGKLPLNVSNALINIDHIQSKVT